MTYVLDGSTGPWDVVVGMEGHAQGISRANLCSGATTDSGAVPHTMVGVHDAALPSPDHLLVIAAGGPAAVPVPRDGATYLQLALKLDKNEKTEPVAG